MSLTKKVIQEQGIEINVNQKDIIDVIVSEKIQNMHDEVNVLVLQHNVLENEVNKFIEQQGIDYKNNLFSINDECDIYSIPHSNYKIKYLKIDYPEIQEVYNGRGKEHIRIFQTDTPTEITYTITHSKKIGDKIYKCEEIINRVPFKLTQSLTTRIKKHNQEVKLLKEKYPEPFSVASIEKQMKNHFTKEILKSTSSEFKQLLKSNFNLTL